MKKLVSFALAVLLTLTLAACAAKEPAVSSSEAPVSSTAPPPEEPSSLPEYDLTPTSDFEMFPYPDLTGYDKMDMPGFVTYVDPDEKRTGIVGLVLDATEEDLADFGNGDNDTTNEINAVLRQYIGSMIPVDSPEGAFVVIEGKTVYEVRITMEPAEDNELTEETLFIAYAIPSAREKVIAVLMATSPSKDSDKLQGGANEFIASL